MLIFKFALRTKPTLPPKKSHIPHTKEPVALLRPKCDTLCLIQHPLSYIKAHSASHNISKMLKQKIQMFVLVDLDKIEKDAFC